MSDDTCKNFVRDSIYLLREGAVRARTEQAHSPTQFNAGRATAYYEVLSTLREQAVTFGLSLSETALADFVPDRELL